MTKLNTWNIDHKRQVNIIIGEELGKTTLLRKLYNDASFDPECPDLIPANGSNGVGFVPSITPINDSLGEGQSRFNYISEVLWKVVQHEGPKLLIIDNPEAGLHINRQRGLIRLIVEAGGPDLKLVVATQSAITYYYEGWLDCVVRANGLPTHP